MASGSGFGLSEYSKEAERLFAEHLARPDTDELDFEEFCATHPDYEEELYGLRADWENVAGLLGVLGLDARPDVPAPALALAADAPVEPERSRAWQIASTVLAALVLGLGGWALRAQHALTADVARLAQANASADAELERTRAATEALAAERDGLRERSSELERARLAADERAVRETARADALAELQSYAALREEEARLWPSVPERAAELESWVAAAEALGTRLAAGGSDDETLAAARREALAQLAGSAGLVRRVRARLDVARGGETLTGARQAAWNALEAELRAAGEPLVPRQEALLPLGRDSRSGLLAFGFMPTWDEAEAASAGRTAFVWVAAPADADGGSASTADLEPYFLSNGPLTATQLARLGGVEGLERWSLRPPTEAEWERAIACGAAACTGLGQEERSVTAAPVEAGFGASEPGSRCVVLPRGRESY